MAALINLLLCSLAVWHAATATSTKFEGTTVACDIAVAGGSTASLAAAITAAEAAPELRVCFLEITDWPGGQMTSGGVPAIDFATANRLRENWPASFRDAMDFIKGNPGGCTVSTKCYLPNELVHGWIMPRLARSKNLQVFLRSAVIKTNRRADGRVSSLQAVQRKPRDGSLEWSARMSDEVTDWYSPADSTTFTKRVLLIEAQVFVEATEMGDVLATSGLPFAQGIESPHENSTTYESACGQAQTLTFYMELLRAAEAAPDPAPPGGDEGMAFPSVSAFVAPKPNPHDPAGPPMSEWQHTWEWRRAFCAGRQDEPSCGPTGLNAGDITQQNLGNDLDTAYMFLPLEAARAQAASEEGTGWRGGLNLTALRMLEDRAYGWFWFVRNSSSMQAPVDPSRPTRLVINRTTSGTAHGLSKMVYWRDSRRAIGLNGYRLTHPPLHPDDPLQQTGEHFFDSVALGDYNDDTHHLRMPSCTYPAYIGTGAGEGAKPYYIPLRALLVGGASNLLVAGKTMSQSFHANSNTRLHPSEWTAGVAAGGTAVLMVREGWANTTSAAALALENYAKVRAFLNSSSVGQPLEWTGLPPPPPPPVGSVCAFDEGMGGRCVGVDARAAKLAPPGSFFNGSSDCGNSSSGSDGGRDDGAAGACIRLASDEWLADATFWSANATKVGQCIHSLTQTYLKKSTALSSALPTDQKLRVLPNYACRLVASKQFAGYWLCKHGGSQ